MPQLTQLIGDDQGIHTAIALAISIVVIPSQHLAGGSRHPYIKSVEYETSEFDLDQFPLERLRRMMRFNKEEEDGEEEENGEEEEDGEVEDGEEEDGEVEVQLGFRNYAYESNWIN